MAAQRVNAQDDPTELDASKFPVVPTHSPSKKQANSGRKSIAPAVPGAFPDAPGTPTSGKKASHESRAMTTTTPKNKSPIKPSGFEMHPAHHQKSTTKPYEEARWLGFMEKGARTEPIKGPDKTAVGQPTPTKVGVTRKIDDGPPSPGFSFTFKRPSLELSSEAQKMMAETRQQAEKIHAHLAEEEANRPAPLMAARKIATPKGRFSDIHKAEFEKMKSIANHPSSFRAKAAQAKASLVVPPRTSSLKRTQSKAELDKPDHVAKKNTRQEPPSSTAPSTTPNKRVKHKAEDDAATTRQASSESDKVPTTPRAGHEDRNNSGIPRIAASKLMTPTKSSLARSHSTKTLKTSKIPAFVRSPSLKNLRRLSPNRSTPALTETPAQPATPKLSVKSILRTPQRLYSDDPTKLAAGTHLPRPTFSFNAPTPIAPATAPVCKHVGFTPSTEDLIQAQENRPATPSPIKYREREAFSVEHPGAVKYPELPTDEDTPSAKASSGHRRFTLDKTPGDFTFRSDKPMSFSPGIANTIRKVRSSLAEASPKKRKVEGMQDIGEEDDKENNDTGPTRAERPSKKAKMAGPVETPHKAASKTPHKGKRPGLLSRTRLNMLATPKKRAT
ncbi:hypothetical protein BDY21DRAFT_349288 [Lineolata rhizophorae]|uniref:Erythromycin esterase n=1 Tax=Lineolata rhizophorae TaxID=578093 RepID=A0A6A6NW25_9PEZI|nr:hypothetical protein BDY21DRAFT_349288 [Lineolata rhizophorae]